MSPKYLGSPLFLVHGVRFVFSARPGPIVRGIPSAFAAPVLVDEAGLQSVDTTWAEKLNLTLEKCDGDMFA